MRVIIVGGPKRGKSSLAKHLAAECKLVHLCTDPQRMCVGFKGTPDTLPYGDVSAWVADNWIGTPGTVIEGVRCASALARKLALGGPLPVDKVIYLVQALEPADKPGQRAQTTKTGIHLESMWPKIESIVENWYPAPGGKWVRRNLKLPVEL